MPLKPLHDAIDAMIPLIPETYELHDELVGKLEVKKQESLDGIKTQKVLRKETDLILRQYLGPIGTTPENKLWVEEVTKAYYAQV